MGGGLKKKLKVNGAFDQRLLFSNKLVVLLVLVICFLEVRIDIERKEGTDVLFKAIKFNSAYGQTTLFEQKRQEWLQRDGKSPLGYQDESCHEGRTYLLAWLEKNKSFDPKLIRDLINPCASFDVSKCPDPDSWIATRSGSCHHVTLARMYYQYRSKLRDLDPNLIDEIEQAFSEAAWDDSYIYHRDWRQSTQAIYLPVILLWTQERDRDATVKFLKNSQADLSFTSSYSGKYYENGSNIEYNTYEFARDWLFQAYDIWTRVGCFEMDGNYTHHIVNCCLLLYDFADRPTVANRQEGLEIKKRSKMVLDLMNLDMGLVFSARHHGGSHGREYTENLIKGIIRWPYEPFTGVFTEGDYIYRDGYVYSSKYRLPNVIFDAINLNDEPPDYYHITMKNNRAGSDQNYTFVSPYFNMGGIYPKGLDWSLSILSNDGTGAKKGQPFRLWINNNAYGGDLCFVSKQVAGKNTYKSIPLGNNNYYQYKNAAFIIGGNYLHIAKGEYSFDRGEENLIPLDDWCENDWCPGHVCENNFTIEENKWVFFLENKTAIAMKRKGSTWAIEVVVIDNSVTADHVYPSFQAFKNSVEANAVLDWKSFKTSRGHVIRPTDFGGTVDNQPIWPSRFKRLECIDNKGEKIVEWYETGGIGIMYVTKHGRTNIYNFNEWTYSEDQSGPPPVIDVTPPNPPQGVTVQPKK